MTQKHLENIQHVWMMFTIKYDEYDEYNPTRNRKILIVFDDMIANIMTNKTFRTIIKELLIRCR